MKAEALCALQKPLKERYQAQPRAALITLKAQGRLGEGITCKVETGKALVEAGLHPATGGDGLSACSGDMLLEALVACAGVTLCAVATAIGARYAQAWSRRKGIWIFGAHWACRKKSRLGFRESGFASIWTPTPPRRS